MPSHTEDFGKTVIRMEKHDMEKHGIKEGEVVRVSGNATTAATCHARDPDHIEPEGSNLEYLNKFQERYPTVRLANTVLSNARILGGMGSLVGISKLSPDERIAKALKVVFSTAREAKTTYGEDYEKRIDFTKYFGNVISRGDMMFLPISDSERRQHLSSVILDVEPPSDHGIWTVQNDTRFETREVARPGSYVANAEAWRLTDLSRVVPIVKKMDIMEDLKLTVPFLEIYENGSKIFFYLTERIHKIETVNVNGNEMKRPAQKVGGLPTANMKISDDLGNSYYYMRAEGHGGGASFPSSSPDWEFFSRNTISYAFWPPIGKEVKELKIQVLEFFWQKHPMPHHFPPPVRQSLEGKESKEKTRIQESNLKHVMTPVRPLGVSVLSGPWEFKVPLD